MKEWEKMLRKPGDYIAADGCNFCGSVKSNMHSDQTMTAASTLAFLRRWLVPLLSFIGAISGIAGTRVLAYHPEELFTVFSLYLISNVAWVIVAVRTRQYWLLLQNLAYLYFTVVGISR